MNANPKHSAQVAAAQKAASLKAKNAGNGPRPLPFAKANERARFECGLAADAALTKHDAQHVHGARAPPPLRLLSKREVLGIVGVSFPTVWTWMRDGKFPRSRAVGGRSMWRSDEIDAWLDTLPVRTLKGDAEGTEATP